jgi:hypothetical protein
MVGLCERTFRIDGSKASLASFCRCSCRAPDEALKIEAIYKAVGNIKYRGPQLTPVDDGSDAHALL